MILKEIIFRMVDKEFSTDCSFFLFIIYSSFIQYILTTAFTPSSPPSSTLNFPLLQIRWSSISLQIRADLPATSAKHDITRYRKTRHKPSYQGWTRQCGRRKGCQEQAEESKTPLVPLLGVLQEPQVIQPQACMQRT